VAVQSAIPLVNFYRAGAAERRPVYLVHRTRCYKLIAMFKRQTEGSVVCASCKTLVGVNDETCYSCGMRNPGLWGYARALRDFGNDLGFLNLVVYGCAVLYVLSLLLSVVIGHGVMMQSAFSFFGASPDALYSLGASGFTPVFEYGRWWTILSASWLHAGFLHIFFNTMMIRQLGPQAAEVYGASRMVIIYFAGGVFGFACSSVAGIFLQGVPIIGAGAFTVGSSAPIFGLLGGLMYYSRHASSSLMRAGVMSYVMGAVMMGIVIPGIDNYAHGGGFLGGYLASWWLNPSKPERVNHFVGAILCLSASALAILYSVATDLPRIIYLIKYGPRL
jgi:rhomboid protease GluP